MTEPNASNVVDHWLDNEAAAAPACPIVAALKASTKSMKLDEGATLTKLRELYEEPIHPAENVANKTN